jgi:hypothetical protein
MALDWLPDATRDSHPRSFPWAEQTDPKGCLHTTESSSWPTYSGWTIMPHATVMPHPGKGVEVRQHLPFSQGSFALRHARSQPTNGDYVFQFELIGTSEKGGPGLWWPGADDAVLLDLWQKVIKPLDAAFVIPFRALQFEAYPASYGTSNGVRLSDSQFDTYSGWLGHQHVPQNDHGDPGAFPWDRLVALAGQQPKPPHPPKPPAAGHARRRRRPRRRHHQGAAAQGRRARLTGSSAPSRGGPSTCGSASPPPTASPAATPSAPSSARSGRPPTASSARTRSQPCSGG